MDSEPVSRFHLARVPPNPGIPAARAARGAEFRGVGRLAPGVWRHLRKRRI